MKLNRAILHKETRESIARCEQDKTKQRQWQHLWAQRPKTKIIERQDIPSIPWQIFRLNTEIHLSSAYKKNVCKINRKTIYRCTYNTVSHTETGCCIRPSRLQLQTLANRPHSLWGGLSSTANKRTQTVKATVLELRKPAKQKNKWLPHSPGAYRDYTPAVFTDLHIP